jgi:hypothetical protein
MRSLLIAHLLTAQMGTDLTLAAVEIVVEEIQWPIRVENMADTQSQVLAEILEANECEARAPIAGASDELGAVQNAIHAIRVPRIDIENSAR